ncbi:MAG: DUF1553 domain-containing protein [Lacipirellulaceae bacterium]
MNSVSFQFGVGRQSSPVARRCTPSFWSASSWRWLTVALVGLALGSGDAALAATDRPAGPDFAHEVRPILSDKCFLCHGPDEATRQADLRLDLEQGVAAVFRDGTASPEGLRRVHSVEPSEVMPPPDSGKPLTPSEVRTLEAWAAAGSPWAGHWSFTAPRRISVPRTEEGAEVGAIDAFVLHRLEEAGLRPVPAASRDVLLRRVSFDLTGLPPTLEELGAFLADDRPDAYQRAVDRLLASPRFGERFATLWLDAARYSDTYGYQRDEDRRVWPWRDWIVSALNRNTPYDEFLRLQLAGDLVANPTRDTVLATAFNRLHGQNTEGGSIPAEFRAEYVADRAQTVAASVLGLTMECCRCHDHKYDPLTIKDYYAFTAFFDKIDENGIIAFFTPTTPPPTLKLPTPEQEATITELRRKVDEAEAHATRVASRQRDAFERLKRRPSVEIPTPTAAQTFDGAVAAPNRRVTGVRGSALRLSGDDEVVAIDGGGAFDRADPYSVCVWVQTDRKHDRAVVVHATRAALDSGNRGHELILEDGKPSVALVHFWPGDAIRLRARALLPLDRWVHLAVTYDGSSRAAGMRLYVDGVLATTDVVRDCLTKSAVDPEINRVAVGARFRDRGFTGGEVDELLLFDRRLSALEIAKIAGVTPTQAGGAESADAGLEHFLLAQCEEHERALDDLRSRRRELFAAENEVEEIMVMQPFEGADPSRVRLRGAYDQLGEVVEPAAPKALPPLPRGMPADRRALAEWIVNPSNPLTARVAVNRLWQGVFGEGLVRTPGDFGAQGDPPSHPELLDHLAVEFAENGWDTKGLIKLMVLSETYQRSSRADAQLVAKDPENRLLGRAAARRWPAEMLRDNALAASGLLVATVGGPPTRPYEVEVSFAPAPREPGEGLYRRSLYTYFKRSAPAPLLAAFDAPDRSVCRMARERTQSPTQALVLLNGTQFVEAARVSAENAVVGCGDDTAALVERLFRSYTSQRPSAEESAVLIDLLTKQTERFGKQPERASALLAVGDRPRREGLDPARVAAATVVTQVIMNCDKGVNRQ